MVTGASTAEAAVVLIDARKGLLPQSRRHIYLAALLGLSEIIIAINKMDLVGYDEARFQSIRSEVLDFVSRIGTARVNFVPISALRGDMVVERSDSLPWWGGPTLLEALEAVDASRSLLELPARFPVQLVSRPDASNLGASRGYLGQARIRCLDARPARQRAAVTRRPRPYARSFRLKARPPRRWREIPSLCCWPTIWTSRAET